MADEPESAWREPWSVRSWRWVRSHRVLVTGGAATVLVATLALAVGTVLLSAFAERERQAKAIYEQRVGALGVSKSARAPLPPSSGTGFAASFDLAPEKPSDPKAAAARLIAPSAPVPVSGTAEVREVKP